MLCRFCHQTLEEKDLLTMKTKSDSGLDFQIYVHLECYNNNIDKCNELLTNDFVNNILNKKLKKFK